MGSTAEYYKNMPDSVVPSKMRFDIKINSNRIANASGDQPKVDRV